MRKLTLALCALFTLAANAQSDLVGTRKVKKEKATKLGVSLKAGPASYSIDGFDCDGGMFAEAFFTINSPFKPSNLECPWHFEVGFGFDYYGGNATWAGKGRGEGGNDIMMIGLFDSPVAVKYVLNALGTRGKWNINAGINFCPLVVGATSIETHESYYSGDWHTLGSEMGMRFGLNIGLAYEAKHFGVGIGAGYGWAIPYSSSDFTSSPTTSPETASILTYGASLKYMF